MPSTQDCHVTSFPSLKWISGVCLGAVSGVAVYVIINRMCYKCLQVNNRDDMSLVR